MATETQTYILIIQTILVVNTWIVEILPWFWNTFLCFTIFTLDVKESNGMAIKLVRWNLYPLYFLLLVEMNQMLLFPYNKSVANIVSTLQQVIFLVSWMITICLPVNSLPKPSGKFKVGTITDQFEVEEERKEKFFDQSTKLVKRRVSVKIWYPAETGSAPAPYMVLPNNEIFDDGLRSHWGFGKLDSVEEGFPFLTDHIYWLTKCNSYYAAPFNSLLDKSRVLIYAHGQGSLPEKNTILAEDLASYGYVTCAFYHSDFDKSWPGPVNRRPLEIKHLLTHMQMLNQNADYEVGARIVPGIGISNSAKGVKGLFYQKLDLSRIGIMGHSFGGATTVSVCMGNTVLTKSTSVKVVGGVTMDPWLEIFLKEDIRKVEVPMLMLNSDMWLSKDRDIEKIRRLGSCNWNGLLACTVKGTSHYNFGDSYFILCSIFGNILLPSKYLQEENSPMSLFGTAKAFNMHSELRSLVRKFFDSVFDDESISSFTNALPLTTKGNPNVGETPYFKFESFKPKEN